MEAPLTTAQHIAQIGLLLVAAIAISGGSLEMYPGQPDTSPAPGMTRHPASERTSSSTASLPQQARFEASGAQKQ